MYSVKLCKFSIASALILILLCGCSDYTNHNDGNDIGSIPEITLTPMQEITASEAVSDTETSDSDIETETQTAVVTSEWIDYGFDITSNMTLPPYTTVSSNAYTDPDAAKSETLPVSETETETETAYSEPEIDENHNYFSVVNTKKEIDISYLDELNSLAKEYNGQSAIYVVNLDDGMELRCSEDRYMFAASSIKLPYIYSCYLQFENGAQSMDDTKEFEERFRRDGTGEIKDMEEGTMFTSEELCGYAIECSDNIAYEMLYEMYGWEYYNSIVAELGFVPYVSQYTKYGSVSPHILGGFWREIYHKKNAGGVWDSFYSHVLNTTYSPIRNTLGRSVEVANKTGWAKGYYHESGIVFREHPYVIVVMTVCDGDKEDQDYMMRVIRAVDDFFAAYNNDFAEKTETEQ